MTSFTIRDVKAINIHVHDTVAPRVPGKDRGTIRVPEDFDRPLPDGVLDEFQS